MSRLSCLLLLLLLLLLLVVLLLLLLVLLMLLVQRHVDVVGVRPIGRHGRLGRQGPTCRVECAGRVDVLRSEE